MAFCFCSFVAFPLHKRWKIYGLLFICCSLPLFFSFYHSKLPKDKPLWTHLHSGLFYTAWFFFLGVKISSSFSAALSSADCIAWAYILPVVAVLECPSRFETVVIGTPAASCSVALVCLSEWSVIGGSSGRAFMNLANQLETLSGFSGLPSSFVKIKSSVPIQWEPTERRYSSCATLWRRKSSTAIFESLISRSELLFLVLSTNIPV